MPVHSTVVSAYWRVLETPGIYCFSLRLTGKVIWLLMYTFAQDEISWRHECEHCQDLLEGRSLIKGSSILPSNGVRLYVGPPVCYICDVCVCMSRKGQCSLSGWDAFTLYGCSHWDSSLRPGLHEVRNIAAQVLNSFYGLCFWDQELFLRGWKSW